jgi:transcriptional regulator with XRE-family HTH domain
MSTTDSRPEWAERLRREREERGWTQEDVVHAMRNFADGPLPDDLLNSYKRYERGKHFPSSYTSLLAAVFGTVSESLFGSQRPTKKAPITPRTRDEILIAETGMDTLEIVQRINRSSISDSTIHGLNLTIEQFCCDYPHANPTELIVTGREWLNKITQLLNGRLTLSQHQDMLKAAGQLALLVGCLEYDIGDARAAEATRQAAMSLGRDAESPHVIGWAYEMRAWFALTMGNYREVIAAAQAGQDAAPNLSVTVQLAAQEAKAWGRMNDRRQVMFPLERGRVLLDSLPYPERPENHFVVDPDKFDFYAMDCYRLAGDNKLAALNANEVLRQGVRPDGAETSPMRNSEARLTLAVVAAREDSLDQAVSLGLHALSSMRQSQPSLVMVASELDGELRRHFPNSPQAQEFHDAFSHIQLSA